MRNASHGHTYSCGKCLCYFAIQLVEWTFFKKHEFQTISHSKISFLTVSTKCNAISSNKQWKVQKCIITNLKKNVCTDFFFFFLKKILQIFGVCHISVEIMKGKNWCFLSTDKLLIILTGLFFCYSRLLCKQH